MALDQICNAITAISTLAMAIAAILAIMKVSKKVLIKDQTLYGREAKERFDHLNTSSPNGLKFAPTLYMGGNKQTPQFEIEKIKFDPQTMPATWKGYTKSVRYYEKESTGEIMEHCWLLK